jgi:hypothetical protein
MWELWLNATIPAAADGMGYVHLGLFPEIIPGTSSPYWWSVMPTIWHTGSPAGWYWIERSEAVGYTDGRYLMIHRDDGGHFNTPDVYQWNIKFYAPVY